MGQRKETHAGLSAVRIIAGVWVAVLFLGVAFRLLADCVSFGLPFTDLNGTSFCAEIAEAYYAGITHGTSPTTFSPGDNVTREQAAAFATRTLDAGLARGSRRAALGQWWTTTPAVDQSGLGITSVGAYPFFLASDGADVWVANSSDGTVSRVRSSDGKKLEDWTGMTSPYAVLSAMGRIFVTGSTDPGKLYMIDPRGAPGDATEVATVGDAPIGITFDGSRIWTVQLYGISIVTPGPTLPWDVVTIPVPNDNAQFQGILFDGKNIWVTVLSEATLLRLDTNGSIIQTVSVAAGPGNPVFDGHNIWVPSGAQRLSVVRASDGVVLKTFYGYDLRSLFQAAFDGQRVLVTDLTGRVSVFRASDLTYLGTQVVPDGPFGVCSDGANFWITLQSANAIGRY